MTAPAERMKVMRSRRRAEGLREVRLMTPDARAPSVRQRVASAIARLDSDKEAEALSWNEAVSEFDTPGEDAQGVDTPDVPGR